MCQLVRPPVQLLIGYLLVLDDYGDRIRCALHLPLEELVEALFLRIRNRSVVPLNKHAMALGLCEQRFLYHSTFLHNHH